MKAKNLVPIVVSVVLGLVAVLLVSKQLGKEERIEQAQEYYLVASQSLKQGDVLSRENVKARKIARNDASRVAIAVPTPTAAVKVYGQEVLRDIERDDFILLTDLGSLSISPLAEAVEPGKWAVTIGVDKIGGVAGLVRPGDEVALLVTLAVPQGSQQSDLTGGGPAAGTRIPATFVLYPRIKVLAIGAQVAGNISPLSGDVGGGGGVTLLCSPIQAQELTHVRQFGRISLAMRRAGDESAVEQAVFREMTDGTVLTRLLAKEK